MTQSEIFEGVTCPECGEGFTLDEWQDRHSEGLDDVHMHCCRRCELGEWAV